MVGFEPHPVSYRQLIDAGLPEHVSLHNLALADRDGRVSFYSGDGKQRTKSSLRPIDYIGSTNEKITVDALTLDSVPERISVQTANFIKLDTEGTEDQIMNGGERMFADEILGVQTEVAFWTEQSGGVSFFPDRQPSDRTGFVLFDLPGSIAPIFVSSAVARTRCAAAMRCTFATSIICGRRKETRRFFRTNC